MKALPSSFFDRPTLDVARDLLGCYLVRAHKSGLQRSMITETEAYDGPDDLACHASKGKTSRTEIMFGPAGYIYVYFVYGMHWMLNIVTGPKNYPAAVLIRGLEGIPGPGRLTKKLSINGFINKKRLGRASGLWIEPRSREIAPSQILSSARIGVAYAGPLWSEKKYRFTFKQ